MLEQMLIRMRQMPADMVAITIVSVHTSSLFRFFQDPIKVMEWRLRQTTVVAIGKQARLNKGMEMHMARTKDLTMTTM
jgi:hypothetical protein